MVFAILLAIGAAIPSASTEDAPDATLVKAAFIYKFLLFVDYPEPAFTRHADELSICIMGPNKFDGAFRPVEGKRVRGRRLNIQYLEVGNDRKAVQDCHLLFIGEQNSEEDTRSSILLTRGTTTLTVGEHEDFLEWGGMIRLFPESGRIAFEVNAASARKSGISFRAQMLRIAKRVVD